MVSPIEIFFSYSHKDEALREELEKQLSLLKWQGIITGWHDRKIIAGQEWANELDIHLKTAQIILLLVSPDFMSSDYCYGIEMQGAMERHERGEARVIPIILRHVYWRDASFGKLQALPKDARPVTDPYWYNIDKAFLNVAEGIRQIVEELKTIPPTSSANTHSKIVPPFIGHISHQQVPYSPYRGLFAFREQDAQFFFGREIFIEQLVDALRRNPLVAVVGSSGSGKSSVVFAGIIPLLRQEGNWHITTFRPGSRPFHSLTAALMPFLEPHMSETDKLIEINKLAQLLQEGRLALNDIVEIIAQRLTTTHLLLFADQFEEIFTLCRSQEVRHRFLDELLTVSLALPKHGSMFCKSVLTMRADFVGQALSYRPFADALQYADLKLGPMTRQELRDAIIKPAEKLGVYVDEGLVERILATLHKEPGNLPLLEFALSLLWMRQWEGKLTLTAYDELGGVERSLAAYADEIYNRLSQEKQKQAQEIFVQLVRPGEGTEDTRRISTRAEIGEDRWQLIPFLSDTRLVVSGRDETTAQEMVEIVHEALIKGWNRLSQWLESDREFRLWQERLRTQLRQWEANGQDEGALLRGVLLVEAVKWLTLRLDEVSLSEQLFIKVSEERQIQETRRWKELSAEAERQRDEVEHQKELDRLKDRFILMALHELRTPLTGVVGYIELLRNYHESISAEMRAEFIAKALRGCEELTLVVGNITQAGRVQDDIDNLNLFPVSLSQSVVTVLAILGAIIQNEHRHINIAIATDLYVLADDQHLRQVLLNLISNAIKYSPNSTNIDLTSDFDEEYITLRIRDHGLGVPPQDQHRLFGRFVRLERDITSPTRGAGMGLYISKQLIEAMGGSIWVESTGIVGEGSMFAFTLKRHIDITT